MLLILAWYSHLQRNFKQWTGNDSKGLMKVCIIYIHRCQADLRLTSYRFTCLPLRTLCLRICCARPVRLLISAISFGAWYTLRKLYNKLKTALPGIINTVKYFERLVSVKTDSLHFHGSTPPGIIQATFATSALLMGSALPLQNQSILRQSKSHGGDRTAMKH